MLKYFTIGAGQRPSVKSATPPVTGLHETHCFHNGNNISGYTGTMSTEMLVCICNLPDESVNPEDQKGKREFRKRKFFAGKKVSRMKFPVNSVYFVVWTACVVDD